VRRFSTFEKPASLPDRQFERDAVLAKHPANLLDAPEEIAVLLVELADEISRGFCMFVEHLPDPARPDLDAAHPVDHTIAASAARMAASVSPKKSENPGVSSSVTDGPPTGSETSWREW
jgi:hypothetical protein